MRRAAIFLSLLMVYCASLNGQVNPADSSNRGPPSNPEDEEEMMYKDLSPSAFFSMKDNVEPMGPMNPNMGSTDQGMGAGMDSMRPGMGPMGPVMGPMEPGMGPMEPGMGPMGPGMGPMEPGMGPMGPGMGPMESGMGPMGPGMGPMGSAMEPGMGPMGPGMGPTGPGVGPMGPDMGPMGPGMGAAELGMKPGAADTRNGKKGYEHFDLSTLDNMARAKGDGEENFALLEPSRFLNDKQDYRTKLVYNICYSLTYIWRRARQSIRKYFHLRDIYQNHLAYEVGYITHVIMAKYQNMLELYEYSRSKVYPKSKKGKKKAPRTILRMHLTQFQHSMLIDSQQIEHLCNMLNELKAKYSARPYNPENRFDIPPDDWVPDTTTTSQPNDDDTNNNNKRNNDNDDNNDNNDGNEGNIRGGERMATGRPKPKGYIAKQVEEAHKLLDKAAERKKKRLQNAREYYKKHGHFPTTTVTQQPMRLWSPNLDYGWSGEDGDDW